jgi:uncharacterized protein YpiB (UPF0302 family)
MSFKCYHIKIPVDIQLVDTIYIILKYMENAQDVDNQIINLLGGRAEGAKKLFKSIEEFLACTEDEKRDLADSWLEAFAEDFVTDDLYLYLYIAALKYKDNPRFPDLFRIITDIAKSRMPRMKREVSSDVIVETQVEQ